MTLGSFILISLLVVQSTKMNSFTPVLMLICILHYWIYNADARALGPKAPFVASGQSVDVDVYLDVDDDDGTDHGRDALTKYIRQGQHPKEERVNGARKLHNDTKNNALQKPIIPLALNTKPEKTP
ncbi:uncharacterized protein LOC129279170 [Lytechinus pictus]|uniref:uncharacterized protein LOC129279170 n=1 Tax=Lytechinus pictus TaxID=7653 RepID=UPI0030BA047C